MPADRKPPSSRSQPAKPDTRRALLAGASAHSTDDVQRLKQQLRDNERIWSGFRRIEIRMIGAHSLRDLVGAIVQELPRTFPRVDCVSVACFDPEYEMTRMLDVPELPETRDADEGEFGGASFISVSQESLQRLFGPSLKPNLGPCPPEVQELMFPTYPRALGSAALAPLLLRGQLIGSLNQGSLDTGHFTPAVATDLLEHLAAVVSMCIDNTVSHERLRVYGLIDPLTGVANRRFFERRLGDEIERWLRRREPLTYMLVDVDHFKQVNDTHGHQVGDQVLQQVAELLGRDLRGADLLGRYGGEEFMLLLPNTTPAQGSAIAQRLCQSVARQEFPVSGERSVPVTISIGVACLDDRAVITELPAAWLFQQADQALYRAKHSGRNRVVVADPGNGGN